MAVTDFRRPEAFEPFFEARSEHEGDVVRVLLFGELDLAAAPLLEQECKRIEELGSRIVAFDLNGLTFMDASGLRAVLASQVRAQVNGRPPPLVNAGGVVRRLFDLTGNGGLLDLDPPLHP